MEITVKKGQSVVDIAVQYAGSAEAAFDISAENNISLTDFLPSGTVLNVSNVVNRAVATFYKNTAFSPASQREEVPEEGPYIFDFTFDYTFE